MASVQIEQQIELAGAKKDILLRQSAQGRQNVKKGGKKKVLVVVVKRIFCTPSSMRLAQSLNLQA